jgi:Sortase domain
VATRRLASTGSRLTILVVVTIGLAMLTGSVASTRSKGSGALAPSALTARADGPQPVTPFAIPAPLIDEGLDLRAGPVPVALELHLPSLGVHASVVGVGITANDVMDAPMGPAKDPIWQQAFWYRGSAVPGELSSALIAGHISGPGGRPAVFAEIDRLGPDDPIVVRDTRSGLDVRFSVSSSETYSLDQAADPVVLSRIYGAGPVAGSRPEPSADGLSHLTLITCAGTFRNGTHDHRLVVYATRTD